MTIDEFLHSDSRVINVGIEIFARQLEQQDVPVIHVDWAPPARGDAAIAALLSKLGSVREDKNAKAAIAGIIDAANQEAYRRILGGVPVLTDVRPAGEVLQGLGRHVVLHAGPPVTWARMCEPMKGAVLAAIRFEGWADSLDEAAALVASGAIEFRPNHDFNGVGPMTGITTRSMQVFLVENAPFSQRAFCTINEGMGNVMRFGGNDDEVVQRLRWMADRLGPALGAALRHCGGIQLNKLIARGLTMGDEMHMRHAACTGLLLRELAAPLAETCRDGELLARILRFISGNDMFFLNVAMPMAKSIVAAAHGIPGSTIVTTMARNGTEFGIRVSGTGDAWFTAPAGPVEGLYFSGFSAADANPDIGDSCIVESVGLGGFAMAASPAVVGFVGAGTLADAVGYTRSMTEITVGPNAQWSLPTLEMMGVPTGIDIRHVVETGLAPVINTAIVHHRSGKGQIGAGIARAPLECFEQALVKFAETMGVS